MKETNVDSMKYRKNTHIAGVDVDRIVAEKGNCILTIKEAYYSMAEIVNGKRVGVDLNGKVVDGYYIEFEENVKPMAVNTSNRKTINNLVKEKLNCSPAESRMLPNWIGMKIELFFNPDVVMKGEVTGGIRVKPVNPIPDISDKNALSILNGSKTLNELVENWTNKISAKEKNIPTVLALKEQLKTTLK